MIRMAKAIIDKDILEIQKNINSKNLVIGTQETLKNLKLGKMGKIFLTSNCPKDVRSDVEHYASLSSVMVMNLSIPNDELGIICKKPFSISVVGFKV